MSAHFAVRELGGKWYVVHLRTMQIVPASNKQTWHATEGLAKAASR